MIACPTAETRATCRRLSSEGRQPADGDGSAVLEVYSEWGHHALRGTGRGRRRIVGSARRDMTSSQLAMRES